MSEPNVYGRQLDDREMAAGVHRELVGGLWEELGRLQFDHLVQAGLRPGMRLLDLGCGCLRGGLYFVRYLEPGHYFGLDINSSLLRAGLEIELPRAGLAGRLPVANLLATPHFEATRFGVAFDMALAQSLFTHLPWNQIRRCLIETARCVRPGGRLFATYFPCPSGETSALVLRHEPGGITSYVDSDPYHYRLDDLRCAAAGLPWTERSAGPWGHPRGQHMIGWERQTES